MARVYKRGVPTSAYSPTHPYLSLEMAKTELTVYRLGCQLPDV